LPPSLTLLPLSVAFIELEGNFTTVKSNKASAFVPKEELQVIGTQILNHIKSKEETPFAFSLQRKSPTEFTISEEITEAFNDDAFLCYFDPSPLLPSMLFKNYLVKLRAHFMKHSSKEEFTLRVLSIRDKISKLTQELNLKDTFYLEFKFTKSGGEEGNG